MAQMDNEQLRSDLLDLQRTLAEERRCLDNHSVAELQVVLRFKETLLGRLRKIRVLPTDPELLALLQQVRSENEANKELCGNRLRFLRQASRKLSGTGRGCGAYGANGIVTTVVSSGTFFMGRM